MSGARDTSPETMVAAVGTGNGMTIASYVQELAEILGRLSMSEIGAATDLIDRTYAARGTVYTLGNGQSATTASAFALDLTKQAAPPAPAPRFRTLSLADNVAAMTAWANDVSYASIFAAQLLPLVRSEDLVVSFSVSGTSSSVLEAHAVARDAGAATLALTGAAGETVRSSVDALIKVDSRDYGHVETAHVAITHFWVDYFRDRLASFSAEQRDANA